MSGAASSASSESAIPDAALSDTELCASGDGAEHHSLLSGSHVSDIECRDFQSSPPADIGKIFSQSKSSEEFCKAMQTLTAVQKYNL